jgi:hypothetical protein
MVVEVRFAAFSVMEYCVLMMDDEFLHPTIVQTLQIQINVVLLIV